MGKRVHISGRDSQGCGETMSMTLSGIPKDQQERVEGMTYGQYWMSVKDGEPVFSPTREPLPGPVEDAEMLPFWRRHDGRQGHLQEIRFDPEKRHHSPSFMVSHLCGFYYTPESYTKNAKLLKSYGFVCMRSPREDNGKFWETWYLPGAWAANGELKRFINEKKKREGDKEQDYTAKKWDEAKRIVSFLCREVSFGTLDVVVQRAAMVAE